MEDQQCLAEICEPFALRLPARLLDEILFHTEIAPGDLHHRLAFHFHLFALVAQVVEHMVGVERRTNCRYCFHALDPARRGNDSRAAKTMTDQQVGLMALLRKHLRCRLKIRNLACKAGEIALASAESGKIEAHHQHALGR